jgi:hypothetical protein
VPDDEDALPLPPDELAAWGTARSLGDLGELTAQFLEGKLSQTPRENTWDGGTDSRKSLRYDYGPFCDPQAVDALCAAWQVTLIDPEWGRDDVLWTVLAQFAGTQPA